MMKKLSALLVAAMILSSQLTSAQTPQAGEPPVWTKDVLTKLEASLTAKYGEGQRARVRTGLQQVSRFWRAEDGKQRGVEVNVQAGTSETDADGENAKISTLAGQGYDCFGVV